MLSKKPRLRAPHDAMLWIGLVAAAALLLSPILSAAPPGAGGARGPAKSLAAGPKGPGPGPVKAGPRPANPGPPRPGPRKPGPPGPAGYPAYRLDPVRHYWHPYYGPAHPQWVWTSIGYPYYMGGTSYIVTSPTIATPAVSSSTETAGASAPVTVTAPADDTGNRYAQIQELTDLVYAWRAMNESPATHERLSATATERPSSSALSAIKTANERFDTASRAAMRDLAEGRSAAANLAAARSQLERLAELFESLPKK